ncbi:MAG: alpha/beta hydrolase [Firmicutes bacterium]|nr:alpha/beta hydrolase [Bacillota bacterium]
MQQAVEFVINGKTLRGMYHRPAGEGTYPTVLLFHGFGGNKLEPHRIFLKLSRRLADAGIAALRFDFSGSGESDGNFEEMTFSSEVREAEAILDYALSLPATDRKRVGAIGLSLGGGVTAALAGRRPEELRSLVLWAAAETGVVVQTFRQRMEEGGYYQDERGCYDMGGLWVNGSLLEDMKKWDLLALAGKFPGSVLIIHGSGDGTVPVETAYKYHRAFPGKPELVIIEDADHTFNRHDWEAQVLRETVDFFKNTLTA